MYWIIEGQLSTLECLLRIVISGICGIVIGVERSRRQKDAGIRTHTIMAMGAALAMIVSKYGFMDMPALDTMRADGSRIASNILTSVGFLGAGVIFTKGGAIKGLTTAAGIWTMAGIGMCIGAGLYTIGIMATIIILAVQVMFHVWMPSSEAMSTHELKIVMKYSDTGLSNLIDYLESRKISVMETNIRKDDEEETIKITLAVRIAKDTDFTDTLNMIDKIPEILSIRI
ncbi:MAG: MgtC/SapB family protein [Clostridia bacterium]|nr:MgtC/SapB family protein [Clostridia bacterium]